MRYTLQVISRPIEGREAEYNRWYDETHVHDVLTVPGFNSCERFMREAGDGSDQTDFVAVYEVETEDPSALLQTLLAASATMTISDALDLTSARFEFLRPMGARKVSAKASAS